jgi:hypothetical protein
MKFPIAWHKECYQNRLRSLAEGEKEIDRLMAKRQHDLKETYDYKCQIDRAEKEHLDGFDSDEFNKKHKGQEK